MQLIDELKLHVKQKWVVVNQAPDSVDPLVSAELSHLGLLSDVVIPEDHLIMEYDWHQRSLLDMPDDSKSVIAVDQMMHQILSKYPSEVYT